MVAFIGRIRSFLSLNAKEVNISYFQCQNAFKSIGKLRRYFQSRNADYYVPNYVNKNSPSLMTATNDIDATDAKFSKKSCPIKIG